MSDEKIRLVRLMAAGEVFTALGPAERAALRATLDALDKRTEALKEIVDVKRDDPEDEATAMWSIAQQALEETEG